MKEHPARLIRIKRDGGELSPEQIRDLVEGIVDGSLGDAQLGAFLMAVCCNGMTVEETSALTIAMRDSGTVLTHGGLGRPVVDKHSTGGVGDKVSLVLAPLVAAAGVAVPMISGRGLGHTGGTIDKLDSIPGYRTDLSTPEMQEVLESCGFFMAAASREIAPADRRTYAVRDVSGTVESIPLITSSILSKKLAEGISGLVMDVKCGRAAFMRERHDAEDLMERIVDTGREAGLAVSALLTDMDHPLGAAAGNALEVAEAIRCLRGEGPADLRELVLALGVEMLLLAGVGDDDGAARSRLESLLDGGAALQCLAANLRAQGGDEAVLDDTSHLGRASVVRPVPAPHRGTVLDIDPLKIGWTVVELGGGRRQPEDPVDPHAGVVLAVQVGDEVTEGQPLAEVHARDADGVDAALRSVTAAFTVGDEKVGRRRLVLQTLRDGP